MTTKRPRSSSGLWRTSALYVFVVLTASLLSAQTPAPTASRTRAYVETLASEKFTGREAGSSGERQAGDYIAAQLARLGARPLPGREDVFMSFDFTAGSRDGGTQLTIGSQQFALLPGETCLASRPLGNKRQRSSWQHAG